MAEAQAMPERGFSRERPQKRWSQFSTWQVSFSKAAKFEDIRRLFFFKAGDSGPELHAGTLSTRSMIVKMYFGSMWIVRYTNLRL